MPRITLSVVIPVYRSESTLAPLTQRLLAVLPLLAPEYEIILVDDGGPDDSWQVLRELQAAHPDRIVAMQLMRNFGQQNAQMCGFRHARGDYIVTMDDDLQHPPEEIPKLLRKIEHGGFDLVYGVYGDKQHSGWRNAGSALINAFYRMAFRNRVMVTSFRIIRSESGPEHPVIRPQLHLYRRAARLEHPADRRNRRRAPSPRRRPIGIQRIQAHDPGL